MKLQVVCAWHLCTKKVLGSDYIGTVNQTGSTLIVSGRSVIIYQLLLVFTRLLYCPKCTVGNNLKHSPHRVLMVSDPKR